MENSAASATTQVNSQSTQPRFASINHISLPCRDLEEAKRFYTEVMGGELVHDIKGFAEVKIVDIIIGMSEQSGGWTGSEAEYPHYAFNIAGTNYDLMKACLERNGVPHHPWTRDYKTALMYFRDPSGNLLELYCEKGYDGIQALPVGPKQGGQPIPFGALNYQWGAGRSAPTTQKPCFTGFSHMSVPCRDLEQAKRFFVQVMGGDLILDNDGFAEVRVAGAIVGLAPREGGWTGREAEYPHYGFNADAENFLPMVEWLERNGVKTPGPWTRDGKKGLMYFRDPSGNLFEIYCGKDLKEAATLPRGAKQGGGYETNFAGLFYDWNG
jgi:catechol 2,3-dioxygenase-like lactoylglutathione lyase family enzyme